MQKNTYKHSLHKNSEHSKFKSNSARPPHSHSHSHSHSPHNSPSFHPFNRHCAPFVASPSPATKPLVLTNHQRCLRVFQGVFEVADRNHRWCLFPGSTTSLTADPTTDSGLSSLSPLRHRVNTLPERARVEVAFLRVEVSEVAGRNHRWCLVPTCSAAAFQPRAGSYSPPPMFPTQAVPCRWGRLHAGKAQNVRSNVFLIGSEHNEAKAKENTSGAKK